MPEWSKAMNPTYVVPHRTTIKSYIDRIYEVMKQKLRLLLSPLKTLSITIDGWKSRSNFSFLVMTGHWISDDWIPMSCTLAVHPLSQSHTAEHLAEQVWIEFLFSLFLILRRTVSWMMLDFEELYSPRRTTMPPILLLRWVVSLETSLGVMHTFWTSPSRIHLNKPTSWDLLFQHLSENAGRFLHFFKNQISSRTFVGSGYWKRMSPPDGIHATICSIVYSSFRLL